MSITNDYGSFSSFGTASSVGAGFIGAFLVFWIFCFILSIAASVLMIVSLWKIFTQNDKPGWYSLIPFLNIWTLFEIVGIKGWWCLVPCANAVFMCIASYKLAIKYEKSTGFAVVTILFPYVGYPMLAFGKKKETEPAKQEVSEEKKEEPKKTTTKKKTEKKEETKFCSECGTKIASDTAFCPNCGAKTK